MFFDVIYSSGQCIYCTYSTCLPIASYSTAQNPRVHDDEPSSAFCPWPDPARSLIRPPLHHRQMMP